MKNIIVFCILTTTTTTASVVNCAQDKSTRCPESCRCSEDDTIVDCRSKHLNIIPMDIPPAVDTLMLSYNNLQEIPTAAFHNMSLLSKLYMNDNAIKTIQCDAFAGLEKIIILNLDSNELTVLPPCTFNGLSSLQQLSLLSNNFVTIPDLLHVPHLTAFRISAPHSTFPPSFENLTKLTDLYLNTNTDAVLTHENFTSLSSNVTNITLVSSSVELADDVFRRFVHLNSLTFDARFDIPSTTLHNLLESLGYTTTLEELWLISEIELGPSTFTSLSNLTLKYLHVIDIANIVIEHDTFEPLIDLISLHIFGRHIQLVPESLYHFTSLRELTLHSEKLRNIPQFKSFVLEQLDFNYCNQMSSCIDDTFKYLPNLRALSLSVCELNFLECDCLRGLRKLETLDLSDNKLISTELLPLADCGQFSHVPNLRHLNLEFNLLKELRDSTIFERNVKLLKLYLNDNHCSYLAPRVFSNLSSLIELDLSNNRLGSFMASQNSSQMFYGLIALQKLRLNNNGINIIMPGVFDILESLKWLDLSNNQISSLYWIIFPNLLLVNISKNSVSVVPSSVIRKMSPQLILNLTGNVFLCSCELIDFRRWISENNITDERLPGLSEYRCQPSSSTYTKTLVDFNPDEIQDVCFPPPWKIIVITVSSSLVITFLITGLVMYRYRWSLRLRLYNVRKRLAQRNMPDGYHEIDDTTEYDLMVSYFTQDEGGEWVREVLIPTIDRTQRQREHRNPDERQPTEILVDNFLVFFEERDVLSNQFLMGALVDAMMMSRKVMLVITEGYLKEGRYQFEMEQAVYKSCSSGRGVDDVIVVLFNTSLGVRLLRSLHQSLTLNRVLHWTPDDEQGKQLFWQQLMERLK